MGTPEHDVKSQKRFEIDVPSQRQPDAGAPVVQRRRADIGGQAEDPIQKVMSLYSHESPVHHRGVA